jgi:hypothetical protein
MGFCGAIALGFGAACGRDVTGAGAPRGMLVIKPAFQTTATNDDVTSLRVIISVVVPAATAGGAPTTKVIADITPNIDSLSAENSGTGGDQTDTVGVVTVSFPLQGAGTTYQVMLQAINASGITTYVGGPAQFTSSDISGSGGVSVQIRPVYVGPGANAARVVASPRSTTLVAFRDGQNSAQLTAQAYDASGNPLSQALFEWVSSDTTVVNVDQNLGTVFAQNKRGTAQLTVTARGALNPTDAVSVSVTLPAQSIIVTAGTGQTQAAGTQLSKSITVKTVAQDGVPVAGVPLTFAASGGGAATPAIATTDASGAASVSWKLGTVVGQQTLTITSPNVPTANVSATATGTGGTGGASEQITLISNNSIIAAHGSSSTVTVLVQSSGTPVPGAIVSFTPGSTGSGTATPSPVAADAQGHASTTWTLGTGTGPQTLIISTSGAAAVTLPATSTASAVPAKP